MKKLIVAGLLGWCSGTMQAQQLASTEMPEAVVHKFHSDFVSVAKAQWQREEGGTYQVKFSLAQNRHPYSAAYDSSGNWLEKKVEVMFTQLPMSVQEELVRRFINFKPLSSVRTETSGRQPVFHVTLMTLGDECSKTYSMDVTPQGQLLGEPQLQLAKADTE